MTVRKIVIWFCNNIIHFSKEKPKFDKKASNIGRPLTSSICELE